MGYDRGWGRPGRSQRGVGKRRRHRARVVVESLERRELLTGAITNLVVVPASVVENQPATGVTVATFDPSPSSIPATSFSTVINWGNGQLTSGNVVADGSVPGQYDVIPVNPPAVGNGPTEPITVTVTLTNSTTAWSAAPSIPTGLSGINTSVAVGANGDAYVLGGDIQGVVLTAAVEVFNPSTNAWSSAASLPDARYRIAAAADSSGKVYAIGGQDASGTVYSEVDVYNPATNSWSLAAPLPSPIAGAAAVTGPNGLIYVFGGATTSSNTPSSAVESYNPATNTWTVLASMPSARSRIAARSGSTAGSTPSAAPTAAATPRPRSTPTPLRPTPGRSSRVFPRGGPPSALARASTAGFMRSAGRPTGPRAARSTPTTP